MASPRRVEKLQREILRVIATTALYELSDPRLAALITFTHVKLVRDLSFATVYYSVLGTDGERSKAKHALDEARGHLQTALSKALSVRTLPQLRFAYDESIEKLLGVGAALSKIEAELAEIDAARSKEAEEAAADSDDDAGPATDPDATAAPEVPGTATAPDSSPPATESPDAATNPESSPPATTS